MSSLDSQQIKELADYLAENIIPEGESAAEVAYGQYQNAIVVHFPYRRSHESGTETLDEAAERLISRERIADLIAAKTQDWDEDE